MVIQPFVENAVWHGLLPENNGGEISVSIENFNNDKLKVRITDNGIGFKKGLQEKKSSHVSKGMKIIEERLKLLNESDEDLIFIYDISELEEDKTGTIVEIILTRKLIKLKENPDS
jgi:sensor histidine kinase YesM